MILAALLAAKNELVLSAIADIFEELLLFTSLLVNYIIIHMEGNVKCMVKKFKVSFLFVRSITDIFDPEKNKSSKYAYKDYFSYSKVLDSIKDDKSTEYSFPWNNLNNDRFWKHYLHNQKNNKKDEFWDHMVPLFFKMNAKATFNSDKYKSINVTLEPYLYHHGIGLVLNMHIHQGDMYYSLDQVKDVINELYNSSKYEFNCPQIGSNIHINLYKLSSIILNFLEKKVIGIDSSTMTSEEPFTVITILEGNTTDIPKEKIISDIENIIRVLDWNKVEEIPISGYTRNWEVFIHNIMFGTKRSRLIWCPNKFLNKDPFHNSLGCYHKNIIKLSLQIESISDLLKTFMCDLRHNNYDCLRWYIKDAQNQLTRLYGSKESYTKATYSSASAVAQINQNKYLQLLNEVRKEFCVDTMVDSIDLKALISEQTDISF